MGLAEMPTNTFMQLWSQIILYPLSASIVIFLSWITVTMVTNMQIVTLKRNLHFAHFKRWKKKNRGDGLDISWYLCMEN